MIWFLVSQIFSTLISLIQIGRMSESDKDLEIMVLRYQLADIPQQKSEKKNSFEVSWKIWISQLSNMKLNGWITWELSLESAMKLG